MSDAKILPSTILLRGQTWSVRKNTVFTRNRSFGSDAEGTDQPYRPTGTRERDPRLAASGIWISPDWPTSTFQLNADQESERCWSGRAWRSGPVAPAD